jgi:hypothetical protein
MRCAFDTAKKNPYLTPIVFNNSRLFVADVNDFFAVNSHAIFQFSE